MPQCTILGPILFNPFLDDLLTNLPDDGVVCYADDTALLIKGGNWHKVFSKIERTMQQVKN